jgi:hypothetical protein
MLSEICRDAMRDRGKRMSRIMLQHLWRLEGTRAVIPLHNSTVNYNIEIRMTFTRN